MKNTIQTLKKTILFTRFTKQTMSHPLRTLIKCTISAALISISRAGFSFWSPPLPLRRLINRSDACAAMPPQLTLESNAGRTYRCPTTKKKPKSQWCDVTIETWIQWFKGLQFWCDWMLFCSLRTVPLLPRSGGSVNNLWIYSASAKIYCGKVTYLGTLPFQYH